MFERFTRQARMLVVGAQEEARELDHDWIGTEHLLLAALRTPEAPGASTLVRLDVTAGKCREVVAPPGGHGGDGLGPADAKALESLGIDLEAVRRRAEETFGPGALDAPAETPGGRRSPFARRRARSRGHIPFTKPARRTLELSLRESLALEDGYIGVEHVVLGLLRADDAETLRLFEALGLGPASTRALVLADLGRTPPAGPLPEAPEELRLKPLPPKRTASGNRATNLAFGEAQRLGHDWVGVEHLLLAVLRAPDVPPLDGLGLEDVPRCRELLKGFLEGPEGLEADTATLDRLAADPDAPRASPEIVFLMEEDEEKDGRAPAPEPAEKAPRGDGPRWPKARYGAEARRAPRGAGPLRRFPYTQEAMEVLEHAAREDEAMETGGVTACHLALGVLRSSDPAVGAVLDGCGVDRAAARGAVLEGLWDAE